MLYRPSRSATPRRLAAPGRPHTVEVPGFRLTLGLHPPGSSLPRHDHDQPTICYVVRGGFTEYSGGEAAACGPATLKVMPAGEPHWNRFGDRETQGVRIDVDPGRFADFPVIVRALDERHHASGGVTGQLARRLVTQLLVADETGAVAAEGLALELVAELARGGGASDPVHTPRWLDAAEEAVREGYRGRLTVAELARMVDVHPATLSRGYRKRFGCTIGEHVRRLRVEHAARELLETSEPLSEIALRAGFYDQSHFTNLFRRSLGVTPGAYRERLAGTLTHLRARPYRRSSRQESD